ncbi:MAG: FecR domain-containing protein [Dysgonomonas sp.]|nr:FecR domain-containing protein [Dysgonomonas sp.]
MDRKTLHNLFNGKATDKEKEYICNWLDEMPEHQDEMIRERKFYDLLLFHKKEKDVEIGQSDPFWKKRWLIETLKIAAVFLLIAGVAFYYITGQKDKFREYTQTVSVPAGQRVDIVLGDGTKVCLNSNSELQYSPFLSGEERRVYLKGEAFFDVTHDSSSRFVVETTDHSVEVLGTQFNVEAYPNYEFVTSLQSGKVSIINHKNPDKRIILQPGQQAVSHDNNIAVAEIANPDIFRWTEGLVCFDNMPFESLMKEIEKSYGVRIIIQNQSIENKFTGKFRVSDGIEHVFKILQKNSTFKFQWDEDKNIIYIQ